MEIKDVKKVIPVRSKLLTRIKYKDYSNSPPGSARAIGRHEVGNWPPQSSSAGVPGAIRAAGADAGQWGG